MKKNFRLLYPTLSLLFLLIFCFGCSKYNQPLSEADNGMHFYVMEGGAVVSGFGHDREVTIPSEVKIDGETYTVTGIGGLSCNKDVKILHLPPTIKKISQSAFEINELEAVYLEDLSAWCNIDFDYDWDSGNTYISYSSNASPFRKETKLYVNNEPVDTLVIPDDTGTIGYFAFNNLNCDKIIIGSGVETIGVKAFMGTTAKEVVLGPDIKDVYNQAFSNCPNMQILRLASSPKMHYEAFAGCNPSAIYCPSLEDWLNIEYYWRQLDGAYMAPQISSSYDLYIGGEKAVDVIVPSVFTHINDWCFAGANIKSVVFEEGVTSLGGWIFGDCRELENVVLPSSITYALLFFENCGNLKTVYAYCPVPEGYSWEYSSTSGTGNAVLYVPEEYIENYKAAEGWNTFKEILPIPPTF